MLAVCYSSLWAFLGPNLGIDLEAMRGGRNGFWERMSQQQVILQGEADFLREEMSVPTCRRILCVQTFCLWFCSFIRVTAFAHQNLTLVLHT